MEDKSESTRGKRIPRHAVAVLHALARCHGKATFAELRKETELPQATLNRLLNTFCAYGYAVKLGHGKYMAGPQLVDMGLQLTLNQIVPGFKPALRALRTETRLNAELYLIAKSGPIYLTHHAAPREAGVPFKFGHLIQNRTDHPAALFYLAIHKGETPAGSKDNFIVDRGGQWPELFRAGAMVPGSAYCIALSGMLTNVPAERHDELKAALHKTGDELKESQVTG